MNLLKIWEGIRNSSFPPEAIKEEVERIGRERRAICNDCPNNSKHPNNKAFGPAHCTLCGCLLKWATHSMSYECPDKPPRWKAIEGISHLESNQIDEITGNE